MVREGRLRRVLRMHRRRSVLGMMMADDRAAICMASSAVMPMGPWWRHPEVVTKLSLTPDQVKRIDEQFMKTREQLIDMHASLEKQQLELEPLLSANPVDQSKALAQISKIADTRAELEKTDAKMLLSIRAVLTADQWTKMRQMHEMHGGPMDGHGDMHAPMAPGQRGHGPSEEPLQ